MAGFKPYTLGQFGGINEDEDPTSLQPNQLTRATNVCRLGQLTGTRPGIAYSDEDYTAALGDAEPIQGQIEWRHGQGASREHIVISGDEVYRNGDTKMTTAAVVISDGYNNVWTFGDHNDKLYAAGGAVGDSFMYWDGTLTPGTWAAIDIQNSTPATIRPKYIYHWKNYLFLCGMDRALPDDNPLVWRYPNLGTDYTDPTNWPVGNTIGGDGIGGLPGYGSNFATGTASYQDNRGDYLLLLTNKGIYSYVLNEYALIGFKQNDAIANGCVSQRAYVNLGVDAGDAVYMSSEGIHSLRLSQAHGDRATSFLSWPIRKTFATLNQDRLKYAVGAYWPMEGLVVFAVSTSGQAQHDLILAMDIQNVKELTPDTVRWYKWSVAGVDKINDLVFARDSDGNPYIYGGGVDGEVFRFQRDVYSDLGAGYASTFYTKHENFGLPSVEKTVGDNYVLVRVGAANFAPTHSYIFDYGRRTGGMSSLNVTYTRSQFGIAKFGSSQFGGGDSLETVKLYGYGKAESIAHRFGAGSTNKPFWIASVSQDIAVSGEAEATDSSV